MITDAGGTYNFTGLTPGDYRVVVDVDTLPAGVTPTKDLDGVGTPNVAVVTLTSGQTRTDADFGYRPATNTASIRSSVWDDLDGDGVRDPGEPGIPGVTVTLTDAQGRVVTTTTDANGDYSFTDLPPGTYTVTITPPPGYTPTTAVSYSVTLSPGQVVDNDTNFGLRPSAQPPAEIPTLSPPALLALLALLLLLGWGYLGRIGQPARTRK